ncbi:MAG: PxKF domain-containing protein, partial [Candidatus Omnitrophota bacterium]
VTDSLSGVSSVSATVPSGQPIDTVSVGTKTFIVSSIDKAGNQTKQTVTYYVRYDFGGILPPINPDSSSIFKLGRVIPVKFQLRDNNGNFIASAIARIYISKISNDVVGTEVEAESVGEANTGNLFRYDSADNQYIFNLGTKALSRGTWQIRIALDDGSSKYVNISLK